MTPPAVPPAEVDFSDPQAPAAPLFGDVYHSRAGALAQARHVFVAGNGLPGRWQGRERFVVLETGFGLRAIAQTRRALLRPCGLRAAARLRCSPPQG